MELPFEWICIQPVLDKMREYSLCRNHIKHRHNNSWNSRNIYPCVDFNKWEELESIEEGLKDEGEEVSDERVWDEFNWNLECMQENFKSEHGFEIFFDMNAYHIMPDSDVLGLLEQREDKISELQTMKLSPDEVEDLEWEINEIDERLLIEGKKAVTFWQWWNGEK